MSSVLERVINYANHKVTIGPRPAAVVAADQAMGIEVDSDLESPDTTDEHRARIAIAIALLELEVPKDQCKALYEAAAGAVLAYMTEFRAGRVQCVYGFQPPTTPPATILRGQVEPAAIYSGDISALIASRRGSEQSLPYWFEYRGAACGSEGWVTDPVIRYTAWTSNVDTDDGGWGGVIDVPLTYALQVVEASFDGRSIHPIVTAWYAEPSVRGHVEQTILPLYRCLPADTGDPSYQPGQLSWLLQHPDLESQFCAA